MKIGIDIGGSSIKCGVIDNLGNIIEQNKTKTPANLQINLKDTLIHVVESLKTPLDSIEFIGVGVPGILDKDNGLIKLASNLQLKDYPITDVFKEHDILNKIPFHFDGDALCAALAEHHYGVAKHYNNSITLTLGTGLGCGVIIDHKPLTNTPEIGHHTINTHGFKCGCGRIGCLETYTSVIGIHNLIKEHNLNPSRKNIIDSFFNDPAYKQAKDEFLYYLATGLSNITYLYWTDTIVLGGGLSYYLKNELNVLIELYESMLITPSDKTNIMIAQYKNEAGMLGASLL